MTLKPTKYRWQLKHTHTRWQTRNYSIEYIFYLLLNTHRSVLHPGFVQSGYRDRKMYVGIPNALRQEQITPDKIVLNTKKYQLKMSQILHPASNIFRFHLQGSIEQKLDQHRIFFLFLYWDRFWRPRCSLANTTFKADFQKFVASWTLKLTDPTASTFPFFWKIRTGLRIGSRLICTF